jgi:hypothetical protein
LKVNEKKTGLSGREVVLREFLENETELAPFIFTAGVKIVRSVNSSLDDDRNTVPGIFESRKKAFASKLELITGKFAIFIRMAVPP